MVFLINFVLVFFLVVACNTIYGQASHLIRAVGGLLLSFIQFLYLVFIISKLFMTSIKKNRQTFVKEPHFLANFKTGKLKIRQET